MDFSEVLAALDGLSTTELDGRAYRHVSVGRDRLSGEGARLVGGRWNPPGSFAVLYLGCDVPTVTREFERLAAKQGRTVDEFLPRDMFTYELRLQRLLDLRVSAHADALRLTPADFADDDLSKCQLIGRAVHAAGFEGLIAPSATGEGEVVVVFLGRTLPGSVVRDVDSERWVAPPA